MALIKSCFVGASLISALCSYGQFALDCSTIDGGGGTSSAGPYTLSATIGQPEAGVAVQSAGSYTLLGGFWSAFRQETLPAFTVEIRNGTLVLSWPASLDRIVVQSATQLNGDGTAWSNYPVDPIRVGPQFEMIIGPASTPPDPIRFFRLHER